MKIIFLGTKHNEFDDQIDLIKNMKKYKDYDTWLEFLYPDDISLLKLKNKEEAYTKILTNLKKNNWSLQYNNNIINIIKEAFRYNINIFGLEHVDYSLESFIKRYGITGFFYYLNDRISDKKNGCNYRWIKIIKTKQLDTKKNQLIFAGRLHKDPLEKILNNNKI
jgi:hypothetical protein